MARRRRSKARRRRAPTPRRATRPAKRKSTPTLFREVDRSADYRTRSMLALPLRDAGGRVFGVLQLIDAIDRGGAVRPFSRDAQHLVQELAALSARPPGVTGD